VNYLHPWRGDKFSQEAVLKGAEGVQTQSINNNPLLSQTNIEIGQYTPGAAPITRRAGETLAQTQARAGAQLAVGGAISRAKANNPGIDLSGAQTVADIDSRVSAHVRRERDEATEKADNRLRLEDDRLYEQRKDAHNLRVMDLEGRIATERSRLAADERQSKRDHEATLRGYDNQLTSFNLENARLMQQEENRRADRKEKALYTLIASLSNLGASFSI
jgi:hypothetical protein